MTRPEIWYTKWLDSSPDEDGESFAVVKLEDHRKIVNKLVDENLKLSDGWIKEEEKLKSLKQKIEKMLDENLHNPSAYSILEDVLKAIEEKDEK